MRTIGLALLIMTIPAAGWAQAQVVLDEAKLQACLSKRIGKDRFACYRDMLGQNAPLTRSFSRTAIESCLAEKQGQEELVCLDTLFGHPKPGLE